MTTAFLDHINETLERIDAEKMMKHERLISSPQAGQITANGKSVINLCANNYLGLASGLTANIIPELNGQLA